MLINNKPKIFVGFLAIAIICLFVWVERGQTASLHISRINWEYKVVTQAGENQLNYLGSEGWELVSVESTTLRGPVAAHNDLDVKVFYFKRGK